MKLSLLILTFLSAAFAYRSAIDYYGFGSLRANFFDSASGDQARGIYILNYRAKSLTLDYNIITTLPDVGSINIHGPARCVNRIQGGNFAPESPQCTTNTGPIVFKLGKGAAQRDGEDLRFQMFSGSIRLNNVEEDMLFTGELYVVVARLFPSIDNPSKLEDKPYLRGALNLFFQNDNTIASILEFERYSASKYPLPEGSIPKSKSKSAGVGFVTVRTDSNTMTFRAFTTIVGNPTYFMRCGNRQKVLASNENPGEEDINFPAEESYLLLEYLAGNCFFFISSQEIIEGDLFSFPRSIGALEAIGLGAKQVPPVNSAGLFYAVANFDRGHKFLEIVVRHNLTVGDVTAAHVHAEDGSVICDLASGNTPLPQRSFCRLNESHFEALEDGVLYINIHTTQNAGGELRGEIVFMGDATTLSGTDGFSSSSTLALAIGLGVGIPLLLIAIVGIVFLVKKGGTNSKI